MRELLFSVLKKDLDIQPFKSSGAGGQKKNKTLSSIRIIDKESGAMAIATKSRSQVQNIKAAWKALQGKPKFKTWLKKKAAKLTSSVSEESINEWVDKEMDNVLIEFGPFNDI